MDDDTSIVVLAMHEWVSGQALKIKMDYMSSCVPVFVVGTKTKMCFGAHLGGSDNSDDYCYKDQKAGLDEFVSLIHPKERLLFVTFRFSKMEQNRKGVVRVFEKFLKSSHKLDVLIIESCNAVIIDPIAWTITTQSIAGGDYMTKEIEFGKSKSLNGMTESSK